MTAHMRASVCKRTRTHTHTHTHRQTQTHIIIPLDELDRKTDRQTDRPRHTYIHSLVENLLLRNAGHTPDRQTSFLSSTTKHITTM